MFVLCPKNGGPPPFQILRVLRVSLGCLLFASDILALYVEQMIFSPLSWQTRSKTERRAHQVMSASLPIFRNCLPLWVCLSHSFRSSPTCSYRLRVIIAESDSLWSSVRRTTSAPAAMASSRLNSSPVPAHTNKSFLGGWVKR